MTASTKDVNDLKSQLDQALATIAELKQQLKTKDQEILDKEQELLEKDQTIDGVSKLLIISKNAEAFLSKKLNTTNN